MSSAERGGPLSAGWLTTIAEAVKTLARHRVGAVVIVADAESVVADGGVLVDGRLSEALLVTLFLPESINALCRGAVVIRDGVLERAAVPVLRSTGWDWVGTLAQDVSAVIVAVSEDDGVVRVGNRQGVTIAVEPVSLAQELADNVQAHPDVASDTLQPILAVLKRSFTQLTELMTTGGEPSRVGIPTDFHRYDRLTGGLHSGEVTVFAGREGVGVNRFVLQIALNIARDAKRTAEAAVLILSPNQTPKDMALPMLGALHASEHTPKEADWATLSDSAATLGKMPIWFDSSPSLIASALKARIRRLQEREPRVVVFIPDLLILGPGETLWGRASLHEDTMATLRLVAREMDVPIVAAVRVVGGADHDAAQAAFRGLELLVDQFAILHRRTTAQDEVYVAIRDQGHLHNFGFRVRINSVGVFLQEPD